MVDGANRHDMKLVKKTLEDLKLERPRLTAWVPQNRCLDKGYDYIEVLDLVTEFGFTAHIRSRGEEAQDITQQAGYRARRWMVERTHIWLNRFRRLLVRWAKKAENYDGAHTMHQVYAPSTADTSRSRSAPPHKRHGYAWSLPAVDCTGNLLRSASCRSCQTAQLHACLSHRQP